MKKIILFGAGMIGKQALEFLGEANVECFVDNSKDKANTIYYGKRVISYAEFIKIHRDYRIIVSSIYYGEIAEQLRASGVEKFCKFMIPNTQQVLEAVSRADDDHISSLVLWGADEYSKAVYDSLPIRLQKKTKYCVKTSDINLFCDLKEIKTLSVDDEMPQVDTVLISSPKQHLADELRIRRILGNVNVLNPYRMETYYSKNELVINKYSIAGNEIIEEDKLNEKNRNRCDYFEAVQLYVEEALISKPLFHLVEIETINRCNGNCSFCPVNQMDDPRKHQYMDSELFYKIIDQLQELSYDGRLSLFSNNEPFLDERILIFSKYAREHLPNAKIHMFTNGTLLTLEKFTSIIPYVDEFIIDNYTEDLHLIKPVVIIKDYCEAHPELIEKVSIVLRKPNELLTSRGGDAPNRHNIQTYPDVSCAFPFQQLIVRPTGEVSLCCNDAIGKYTMGDLSKERIVDVWYGKKYQKVRELICKGRKNVGNCQFCDTFSLYL